MGTDVGLAHFGFAFLRVEPELRLLDLGIVVTKKHKKASDSMDQHRRGQELYRTLAPVFDSYPIAGVCCEAVSYCRNAANNAKTGRAWGVLDSIIEQRKLPLIHVSPQELKRLAAGKQGASKVEVQEALDAKFGGAVSALLKKISATGNHEHPVDALGAIVACLDSDEVRLLRSASRARQTSLELVAEGVGLGAREARFG